MLNKGYKMKNIFIKAAIFVIFLHSATLSFSEPADEVFENIIPKEGEYSFSLEDATILALKNNFDIQLAKYDRCTW